jgi:hypothetical protein
LMLGFVLIVLLPGCAENHGPTLQWSKTFPGGTVGNGNSMQQTIDGGYIICGNSSGDIWLIKTDAAGETAWDSKFSNGETSRGEAVQQTTDGGYIICGHTGPFGDSNPWDIWLMKIDANGNKLWDNTFSDNNAIDWGHSVQQTADGGYIVCGETRPYFSGDSYLRLIKTDTEGNKVWDKKFGDLRDSIGNAVQQTKDGGYIVCGETRVSSEFSGSVWLIKTDAEGNKLWDRVFDDQVYYMPRLDYYVRSVQQTKDGGYMVGGTEDKRSVKTGSFNVWLMKTDAEGNKLWDKRWDDNNDSYGHAAQQTKDGGYVICGTMITRPFWLWRKSALWLIKTNADGNILWDETFIGNGQAGGNSVQQTVDGGYIVCGDTRSDKDGSYGILLLKIAPENY